MDENGSPHGINPEITASSVQPDQLTEPTKLSEISDLKRAKSLLDHYYGNQIGTIIHVIEIPGFLPHEGLSQEQNALLELNNFIAGMQEILQKIQSGEITEDDIVNSSTITTCLELAEQINSSGDILNKAAYQSIIDIAELARARDRQNEFS